jgi:hypothetical protein
MAVAKKGKRAQDLFGPKWPKRTRQGQPPQPKNPTAKSPKRVLPVAIGAGPDPVLLALFDNASGLGQCNARLKIARPELDEAERFALLRAHFAAVNTKWLASIGRKELVRMARRHPSGFEDFLVDDDEGVADDGPEAAD